MTYVFIVGLLIFIVLIAVLIPQRLDHATENLRLAIKGLMDDYFLAHAEQNLERRKLLFHKLTVSSDRVLGHLMSYLGFHDKSVKQQIVKSLKGKAISYEQYKILKNFHHMRNEVVHEGLEVYGDNENKVYGAVEIMKNLIK